MSFADDHTPKRKLISELKKEITKLGAEPVKRKNLLSSLQKWIDELEKQLKTLKEIEALKAELTKELEELGEKPIETETSELEADEQIIALRKQIDEAKKRKQIEALKAELTKELEELGEKPLVTETSELESDKQIVALRKQIEEAKIKKKEAEEKKKRDAKIAAAVDKLKDEIAALGEEPNVDTSDIDSDEQVKALKEQVKKIKERKKAEKAEAKRKAEQEKKAEKKKQTRLKAVESVKKEILFMGETPMSEYEFTSEDEYIAALRKQVEEIKKIKEEEEFKINAEIPDWYVSMPPSSETIMYARGSAISADLDNSEQRAVENALIKLSTQMQNRISNKTNLVIKEAGVDADLTLKTEMQRISSVVVKNATIRGYKVYKTKMAAISNGKYRTFVLIEFPVSLAYKNFIAEIDNNVSVKAEINKLKNTDAFKELEQYVAEFTGA